MLNPGTPIIVWPHKAAGLARLYGTVIEDDAVGITLDYTFNGVEARSFVPWTSVARVEIRNARKPEPHVGDVLKAIRRDPLGEGRAALDAFTGEAAA